MNKKKIFGLFFVFLSLIVFLANSKITGAVIGTSISNFISIFAVGFFITGILLFLQSRNLEMITEEGIALPSQAAIKIEERHPGKKSIVLDTSYVASYTERGAQSLMNDLSKYGEIIVPDSVLKELSSKKFIHLKPIVEKYKESPLEGFEIYRKPARAYLEKTEKPTMFRTLHPILEAVLSGKRKMNSLTKKELELINKKSTRLQALAKKDKFNMIGRGLEGLYKTRDYLEQHCQISDADVDILATALTEAKYNNIPVIIAGKDIDFEQATDMIKGKPDRKINWKLISYETPYKEN